jgi:hypothetical protein
MIKYFESRVFYLLFSVILNQAQHSEYYRHHDYQILRPIQRKGEETVRICTFSSVLESHSNLLHLIATHQIEVPIPVCAFATHVNDHLLRVAIGIEAGTDELTIASANLNLHLLKSSDVDCLLWLSRSQDDIAF